MATINFRLIGKTDPAEIYITLSNGRNSNFSAKTGYSINIEDWSNKTKRPKQKREAEGKKQADDLKNNLDNLQSNIYLKLNEANFNQEVINSYWLKKIISEFTNTKNPDKQDLNLLVNYFNEYIENLPIKVDRKGNKSITKATITKYRTVKKIVEDYQKHKKTNIRLVDVNDSFAKDFYNYLKDQKKYSDSYIGKLIGHLKTICIDAKKHGFKVSNQLDLVKGFRVKAEKIFLSFAEIEQISKTKFDREALENAKDWLIIGCFIGQRVSDLLKLTNKSIKTYNGQQFIELIQQKTNKRVIIPLYDKIKEVLIKKNWQFPYKISDQKFNTYIKEVAEQSGINEMVKGAKIDPKTKRKVSGNYPKYELVTSHICRRSFATNFYGEIPTALLISITGHSTEHQFLEYTGKTPLDNATQFLKYYSSLKTEKLEFTISKNDNLKTGTNQ